jgi:3-deoxy-manno-octulosonate cytidylyltransferase (CMP-KDO synthetase)
MDILIVVPARLDSTRFPRKPLALIAGREMILRVLDNFPNHRTIVATPDVEIAGLVTDNGYDAFVTKREARTGTDRLVELSESIKADIYVNVQGDEPLVTENTIGLLIEAKISNQDKVIGAMCTLDTNLNDVKIIDDGNTVSISRKLYKQVGLYAFNEADLRRFGDGREWEGIEITRFIDNGTGVKFVEVPMTQDVNVPEDIPKVERVLWQRKK